MSQTTNDFEELRQRLHTLQNPGAGDQPTKPTIARQRARIDDLERRVKLLEVDLVRLRRVLHLA
jgi:polyhydroxyalkanoate synthesis regulator phasin